MKPYQPYKESAFLVETAANTCAVKFRGVHYRETSDITALGVLLFALRPAGLDFRGKHGLGAAMHLMQHAAYILHLHANNDRHTQTGERRIEGEDLRDWIARAMSLAPDAESAAFVRMCIDQALGPYAYLSDDELRMREELHETAQDLHKGGAMSAAELAAAVAALKSMNPS